MKKTMSLSFLALLLIFSHLLVASSSWGWWYNKRPQPAALQTGVSSTTVYLPLWGTTGRRDPNALIIKPKGFTGKTLTQWTCSTTDEDGNILLGGTSNNRFAVAWITNGQSLEGSVLVFPAIAGGTKEKCKAIAIDTAGNIVLAGTSSKPDGTTYFAAARVTPKRTIDNSFGKKGMMRMPTSLTTGVNDQCTAVAFDNLTNIILTGTSSDRSSRTFFGAVRLTSKGMVDTTFGKQGIFVAPSLGGGINNQCQAVTIDASNNIVLSGTSSDPAGNSYFAAIRIPTTSN
jgi:uncharacterized delta-60 repeat protein